MIGPTPALAAALAGAVLALAPMVSAEVYRSVTPDGRVIYSDRPPSDAVRTDQIAEPPPPPADRRQEATEQAEQNRASRAAIDEERRAKSADVAAAEKDVRDAERELAAARKRLEAGQVEQEGDRTGTVGGKARRSDAYLTRVGRLEAEVATAQARLKEAKEALRRARAR